MKQIINTVLYVFAAALLTGGMQGVNAQKKLPTKPSTSTSKATAPATSSTSGASQTQAPNRDDTKVAVDLIAVSGQTDPVFRSVEAKWKVTVPTGIIAAGFDAFIEIGLTNGQTSSNTSNGLSATTRKSGFIVDLRLFSGNTAPAFDCGKCPPPAQRAKGDSCDRFCGTGGTANNGVKVRSTQTTNAATLPDINRVKVTITARFKDTVRGGTFTKTITREEAVTVAGKR